jgi:hypothetical protein
VRRIARHKKHGNGAIVRDLLFNERYVISAIGHAIAITHACNCTSPIRERARVSSVKVQSEFRHSQPDFRRREIQVLDIREPETGFRF